MRVLVPEVATHVMEGGEGRNQEILSVDTHPSLPLFVSAGAGENRVILWQIKHPQDAETKGNNEWLTFLSEFTAMTFENTVNILRFSPCGKYLACGDSNGLITLLSLKEECKSWLDVRDERHVRRVHLRGHTMDVQDFAWSPDSSFCASAAMDNFVLVWDVLKCTELFRLKDHTHYAQGVTWSPDGTHLATASFDETVRVYKVTSKAKKITSVTEVAVLKKPRLFADEFRAPTFSRRLSFSPEIWSGLLVTPGGLSAEQTIQEEPEGIKSGICTNDKPVDEVKNEEDQMKLKEGMKSTEMDKKKRLPVASLAPATHVFRLANGKIADSLPIATLKGAVQASLAVRFHPHPFQLVEDSVQPWASFTSPANSTDVRFIFAVATVSAILLYDTQHPLPIAVAEKLHYASYTDLAWTVFDSGETMLVASSRDGCFSMIQFDRDELGKIVLTPKKMAIEEQAADNIAVPEKISDEQKKDGTVIEIIRDSETGSELPMDKNGMSSDDHKANVESPPPNGVISPQHVDENSSSSQPTKKRRLQLENLGGPTDRPTTPDVSDKPINTLQPRRVKLENIQPR